MCRLFREQVSAWPESTRGEGESPTVELVDLGGEEGQESIGLFGRLTMPGEERLLNRSKALESGSTPVRVELHWSEAGLVDASLSVLCRRLRLELTSRHGGSLVYQRAHVADVGFNPDVASGVQKGNFDRNGIGSAK
jgi:hypothetical protein